MSKPKLNNADFCRVAKKLRCEVAAIKAVSETESRGSGFYSNGFPTILYERHIFRKYTNGKYSKTHPHLSGPQGNYGAAGQNQRNKFNEAFALDPNAAMMSCSWGVYQIMGFNYAICGFSSVGAFVDAMKEGEGQHLDAFVNFVIKNGLDKYLRTLNWASFAKGYNGAGYRKNKYDTKMANFYVKFSRENINCSNLTSAPKLVEKLVGGSVSLLEDEEATTLPSENKNGSESPQTPAITIPVVEVEQIVAAVDEKPEPEETLVTRVGNKINVVYTAAGTAVSGIIAWFAESPAHIIIGIMVSITVLGALYMILHARNVNRTRDRELEERKNQLAEDTKLKLQRETQAFELQKITLNAAADKDLNTVRLVPPATIIENSDSEGE